jgi:class 3 adenylate cyclase
VTVICANFHIEPGSGIRLSLEQSAGLLKDLMMALDDSAGRRDAERLSVSGAGYLACCGMSRYRLDHAARILDFAQDVLTIVAHIRRDRGAGLHVRIGIESGAAAGSAIGLTRDSYQLAGPAVSAASTLAAHAPVDSILVGRQTRLAAQSLYRFQPPVDVPAAAGGSLNAWRLVTGGSRHAESALRQEAAQETVS